MTSLKPWRSVPCLVAIALLAIAPAATAAITPESDVLLPWFEVDLAHPSVGVATAFSVVNASPGTTRTRITLYTNWGIPVLEVPLDLRRTESRTIDLRAWIIRGVLPHRTLSPDELAHLQAALTGMPSPADGLYYGSAVRQEVAVGYVITQTLDERPDSLWGDTYTVDVTSNYFAAETLTALSHGLKADCRRHGLRFLNDGSLIEGAELIIWSGRRFSPSATATPSGAKMRVTITVFDEVGRHVRTWERDVIGVESFTIRGPDVVTPIGWLDVKTEEPTFVFAHLHSSTLASAELHSYCLAESLQLAGPGIAVRKTIGGEDADAPEITFTVGHEFEFEYRVTNTGTVALASVSVVDSAGLPVTCPKGSLDPGETMVCTARAVAEPCLQHNVGSASGVAADGKRVVAEDAAFYEGLFVPALTLKTLVSGDDANDPPGPVLDTANSLPWTFIVTNSGNVRLKGIAVTRQNGDPASCPKEELDPGESMTCTAHSLVSEGSRHEVAAVTGADECGKGASATDPAYYFGRNHAPAIQIRKYVGENDANAPPGPRLPAGSTVPWRFLVTNTGNVRLENVVVTDEPALTPVCPGTVLEPGESMVCTAASSAAACQQSNTATATATDVEKAGTVTATDAAYYFGEGHPELALELRVNGENADEPPGPTIDAGTTILLTYEVTNRGDVELSNISASDDRDRPATCPKTALMPGESMVCTASMPAAAGARELAGAAYGRPPCGDPLIATDPAFYVGRVLTPDIEIVKMTNGVHAEDPPGPSVAVGSAIQWTYVVTNSGTVPLTSISVTDDGDVSVTCPKTALEPGESMTCSASGIARACQYSNTAVAQGQPPEGEKVTASDGGYYYGTPAAAISIDKRTNGDEAATPPGPSINTGAAIQWTFVVTNIGDVNLTDVVVLDDRAPGVTCPKSTLASGESMTCTASGTALAGPQRNVVTVSGKPPCGEVVTATDASHYRGVSPGIQIEKLLNGQDADDSSSAVQLLAGAALFWSFVVTNTGDVALSSVAVSDTAPLSVACPKTTLEPGESMTCTASSEAVAGLHCDTGTAAGTSPQSTTVTGSDAACYRGNVVAIGIEKLTNGDDADVPPGPQIPIGSTVVWTYMVTNTGDVTLTGVTVTDDRGVEVTCPKSTLAAGETMTCTGSGTAVSGAYGNVGTATGTPSGGAAVSASDPSHYTGAIVLAQGCVPGFWKNNSVAWPPTGYSPPQPLTTVFAPGALAPYPAGSSTMNAALSFGGGPGVNGGAEVLLRAGVAALLNAAHPAVSYPLTPMAVIVAVENALMSGNRDVMLSLAASLDAMNNGGCPL